MSILAQVIGKDTDFIDKEGLSNTTLGSSLRLRLNPWMELFCDSFATFWWFYTQFTYNSQHQLSGLEAHASGLRHEEQFYVPQSYVPQPSPTTYPFLNFTPPSYDPNLVTPYFPPPFHANWDQSPNVFSPMPIFLTGGPS